MGLFAFLLTFTAQSQQPGPIAQFRPFVAQGTEEAFANGETKPERTTAFTFARRRDGSHVDVFATESPDGTRGYTTEITDFQKRQDMAIEPFTESVTTFHHTEATMEGWRRLEKRCATLGAATSEQHATILGYDTFRVIEEDRTGRSEEWVAPALDCYALRSVYTSYPLGARNERTVASVVEGQPTISMFRAPSSYVERSPSQVDGAYAARFHQPYWGKRVDVMEQRYEAVR